MNPAAQPSPEEARRRKKANRLRRWLARALALVLVGEAYLGLVVVPWPAAGWYTAPMGVVGPTFLFWEGQVYQYIDGGAPRFVGWYETEDNAVVLTNKEGARIVCEPRGWGMLYKLPGDDATYYAYREWRFQLWWKLRQYPLPEPTFPQPE